MRIKIGKYSITHDTVAKGFFNLQVGKVVSDAKSKNFGSIHESTIAYSITLSRAMDIISSSNLENGDYDDIVQYVNKKEKVIRNLLKSFDKNSKELYNKLSVDEVE